jgi:hypothetical protein
MNDQSSSVPQILGRSSIIIAFTLLIPVELTDTPENRQELFGELIEHRVGLAATGCPIPPRWATGGCSHSLTLGNVSTAARQAAGLLSGAR